jgi:hypothetical protein
MLALVDRKMCGTTDTHTQNTDLNDGSNPIFGHVLFGLTNRGELTQTHLETFHPFTHFQSTIQTFQNAIHTVSDWSETKVIEKTLPRVERTT